jgi:phosphoribosylformylglycinamidine cyclo-ligase
VNDVLVTGGEPFLFLDYYATSRLDVDVAERVINGIARACELAGCALAGGETAEMPGFYGKGDYDLAGFCVGVVERDRIIDGRSIRVCHKLIGLASAGPHSNGYSLIRRILADQAQMPTGELFESLMAPTRIYVRAIHALLSRVGVAGMAHITGGGIIENVPRMFADESLAALIDLRCSAGSRRPATWPRRRCCAPSIAESASSSASPTTTCRSRSTRSDAPGNRRA